jgi:RND family efflux transporter MFP subunit
VKGYSWLLATALVVAGCKGAGGGGEAEGEKAPVSVEMATVETRSIRATVAVPGSFVPAQGASAKLAATGPGRVASVLVHEGDEVKAGQLLAVIENRALRAQSQSATLGAQSAAAQARSAALTAAAARNDQELAVASARLALKTAQAEAEGDETQRRIDLQTAQADLSKLLAGARPQERAQARQTVVQAEVTLRHAQEDLRRTQALADEGFAPKKDLADARAGVATAASSLEAARAAESLVLEGARPQERGAARLRVQATQKALANAQEIGKQKVALAQAALEGALKSATTVAAKRADAAASAQAAKQQQASASAAEASAAVMELRAPFSGRITHRYLNAGDAADTTAPVVEEVSSSQVEFLGSLPAADAAGLKPGMAATVPNPAGGDPLSGKVTSVSSGDAATGLSSVRIALAATAGPKEGAPTAGVYATATVVTEVHEKAIAAPSEAVVSREGKTVAYVVDGDAAKQVEIETGAEDGGFTEITKGLKVGDKVVKLGQSELTDGAKVKQAEAKPDEKSGDAKTDEKGGGG